MPERSRCQAKAASRKLALAQGAAKNAWLTRSAEALRAQDRGDPRGQRPRRGRRARARAERGGHRSPDAQSQADRRDRPGARSRSPPCPIPIGEVVTSSRRPNGLEVSQVRVPLGVIFMIYESRPNVTVDAAALCVKSGNAVILRGGKEAIHSNRALHRVLADELAPVRASRARRAACSDHRPRGRRPSCWACPSSSTWPSPAAARA